MACGCKRDTGRLEYSAEWINIRSAGDGCRAALLNVQKRIEANWCSRNVEYLELTVEPTFEQDFMEAMQLPHMTDKFPHLEGVVPDYILNQGPKGPVRPE